MKEGKPTFKSIGHLAFGPEDILFVADTKAAALVAIATGDTKPASGAKLINVEGINQKIAALLGTTADQILSTTSRHLSRCVFARLSGRTGRHSVCARENRRATRGGLARKVKSRAELPDAPIDGVVGQPNRQINHGRNRLRTLRSWRIAC
jgi:hypothetical protein